MPDFAFAEAPNAQHADYAPVGELDSVEYNPPDRGPGSAKEGFEIGLVLAGAVSAGAYIAGMMDFLFEALDAWQQEKERNREQEADPKAWDAPSHDAFIRVITGASGGAMNAAIAAAAAARKFDHVRSVQAAAGGPTGNPFFDAWVNDIDMSLLLATTDIPGGVGEFASLLDSSELRRIADRALQTPPGALPAQRAYLANPLRVMLTVGNLRGVPYFLQLRGNSLSGHGMAAHADHVRFALSTGGPKAQAVRPDEFALAPPSSQADQEWSRLALMALASGGFPVFLSPRGLDRPYAHYRHRVVIRDPLAPNTLIAVGPAALAEPRYDFVCVDGGTMNNEPIDLARRVLSGACGSSPRAGLEATRATVLVDPFPEVGELGPSKLDGLRPWAAGLKLTGAWKNQARFKAEDLALANHPEVYSRFLIAPVREAGSFNLASSVLDGFGGFLSRHFRVHDFLLGRRNCQRFLSRHFVLPEKNELFDGWNPTLRAAYATAYPDGAYLPIVPLMKNHPCGAQEEPEPAWPAGRYEARAIEQPLGERFDAVWFATLNSLGVGGVGQFAAGAVRRWLRGKVVAKAKDAIAADLRKRGL